MSTKEKIVVFGSVGIIWTVGIISNIMFWNSLS